MTIPHLMNCSHSEDGWCLECVKQLYSEVERLRQALAESMFNMSKITQRCVQVDSAGNDYEIDWTDEMKRWSLLAGVDLSRHDPFYFMRR